MPNEEWQKTYYFEKDFELTAGALDKLLGSLEKRGPIEVDATFRIDDERTITAESAADVREIAPDLYPTFSDITIHFDLPLAYVIANFRRLAAGGQLRWATASSITVCSKHEEQIYLFKALKEMFEDQVTAVTSQKPGFPSLGRSPIERAKAIHDEWGKKRFDALSKPLNIPALFGLAKDANLPISLDEAHKNPVERPKPASVEAETEEEKSNSAPRKERNATGAILMSALTLGLLIVGVRQCGSSERQTTASETQTAIAEKQDSRDSGALFKLVRLPYKPDPDAIPGKRVPLDLQLSNVGRAAATDVVLTCGESNAHGPYMPIGTFGPGESRTLHFLINEDSSDLLHNRETLCFSQNYLSYTDGSGAHRVRFDDEGNAQSAGQ